MACDTDDISGYSIIRSKPVCNIDVNDLVCERNAILTCDMDSMAAVGAYVSSAGLACNVSVTL